MNDWRTADDAREVSAPRRWPRIIGLALAGVAIAGFSVWSALALWYRLPGPAWVNAAAGVAMVAAALATMAHLNGRRRWRAIGGFAVLAAAVLLWWSSMKPPAAADFAPDVARQVTGEIAGDRLTLRDVRNFSWRSNTDMTERWEERTYDLAGLATLDLFLSHWDDSGIAHMIMSFGFADGRYLAWSVEVRRLRGSEYSPYANLFRESPLVTIAADERDVVGVRTNVRGEDVHRYRLNLQPQTIRRVLAEYVAQANALAARPIFYNSLTTNCTTAVVAMMRAVGATVPLDWRLLLNSRLPEYAFDHDALEPGLSLAEAKARAPIGRKALAAGLTPEFSAAIRAR
jgi:Domain of unknown function (DUF4105)